MGRRRVSTKRRSSTKHKQPWTAPIPLIAAVLLLCFSLYVSTPSKMAATSSHLLASAVVGMTASVTPNSDNTLAKQLSDKEADLMRREAALSGIYTQNASPNRSMDSYALYSFALSMLLFFLLSLNYYLDWKRSKPESTRTSEVVVS